MNAINATGVIYDLQGSILIRRFCTTGFHRDGGTRFQRGNVSGFSRKSASRLRRYLRCCIPEYRIMLTLTYGREFPTDGREVKRHLKKFIGCYEYHILRGHDRFEITTERAFSFFWFLEFQARGAPHFHAFTTHPLDYKLVARIWNGIIGGDTDHLSAGTRTEWIRSGRSGTVSYANKYAAKLDQKTVPSLYQNVGRFWGVSGDCRVLSATIGFTAKQIMHSTIYALFVESLNDMLKGHCRVRYGAKSGGLMVLLIDETVKERIEALFHRFGLRTMLPDDQEETGYFEWPMPRSELDWLE